MLLINMLQNNTFLMTNDVKYITVKVQTYIATYLLGLWWLGLGNGSLGRLINGLYSKLKCSSRDSSLSVYQVSRLTITSRSLN